MRTSCAWTSCVWTSCVSMCVSKLCVDKLFEHVCEYRLRPSGCKQRPPSETSTRPRGARVVKREIPGATCMGSLELPYAKFVLCVNRPTFVQDLGHCPKLYVHCFHGKLHGSSARACNHIRPHPTPPMINVTSSG